MTGKGRKSERSSKNSKENIVDGNRGLNKLNTSDQAVEGSPSGGRKEKKRSRRDLDTTLSDSLNISLNATIRHDEKKINQNETINIEDWGNITAEEQEISNFIDEYGNLTMVNEDFADWLMQDGTLTLAEIQFIAGSNIRDDQIHPIKRKQVMDWMKVQREALKKDTPSEEEGKKLLEAYENEIGKHDDLMMFLDKAKLVMENKEREIQAKKNEMDVRLENNKAYTTKNGDKESDPTETDKTVKPEMAMQTGGAYLTEFQIRLRNAMMKSKAAVGSTSTSEEGRDPNKLTLINSLEHFGRVVKSKGEPLNNAEIRNWGTTFSLTLANMIGEGDEHKLQHTIHMSGTYVVLLPSAEALEAADGLMSTLTEEERSIEGKQYDVINFNLDDYECKYNLASNLTTAVPKTLPEVTVSHIKLIDNRLNPNEWMISASWKVGDNYYYDVTIEDRNQRELLAAATSEEDTFKYGAETFSIFNQKKRVLQDVAVLHPTVIKEYEQVLQLAYSETRSGIISRDKIKGLTVKEIAAFAIKPRVVSSRKRRQY